MIKRRLILGIAFLALGAAFVGMMAYRRSLRNRPPLAIVTPASQRIATVPGSNQITAIYRVTNAGGRDLILGEPSTTCGCSVASIEPKVLKSGEQGVITVQGTAPNVGERTVGINVSTNSSPRNLAEFQLTMVGSSKPPFVIRSSGSIRLGYIRPGQGTEKIWVETVENPGETPWIHGAECPSVDLTIEGGLAKESPYTGGAVSRLYEWTARLACVPKVGEVRGEVIFRGISDDAILRLPLAGIVRPAAFATPAALFADSGPEDGPLKFALLISSDDPGFPLDAEAEGTFPDGIEVRRTLVNDGRISFEVACRKSPPTTVTGSLSFKTNHPDALRVNVPLTVRVPNH